MERANWRKKSMTISDNVVLKPIPSHVSHLTFFLFHSMPCNLFQKFFNRNKNHHHFCHHVNVNVNAIDFVKEKWKHECDWFWFASWLIRLNKAKIELSSWSILWIHFECNSRFTFHHSLETTSTTSRNTLIAFTQQQLQ
jgi:hypothetical protein